MAVITLDPIGGGVASASRLLWRVFQEEWPGASWLLTLDRDGRAGRWDRRSAARLRFGARLAHAQAFGTCRWVVYSHLSAALVQSYIPAVLRKPYAIFLHGIEAWRPLSARHQHVLQGASLLLANSRYTARRIAAAHPWIGRVAECELALGAPDQALDPEAVLPTSPQTRDVLIVGRMSSDERYKGHDALLEVWPAVVARMPDARLVVVGTGDDEPRLRRKALDLGLDGSVQFAGFSSPEALASAYRRAAVFAMPSRNEGFGLVYLEAMAHALPCIGSIHDAAGDVIEDGVTGFLVDQADGRSLFDRIVRLLSDDELRRRMGIAGRRRLQQRFGYTAFRDRVVSLCEGALDGAPALLSADRGRARVGS